MAKATTTTIKERRVPTPAELRASSEYRDALDAEINAAEQSILPEFLPADPYMSFLWVRVELKGHDDAANISATMGGRLKYVPAQVSDIVEEQREQAEFLIKRAGMAKEPVIRVMDSILMMTRAAARLASFDAEAERRKATQNAFKRGLQKTYDGKSLVRDYEDNSRIETEEH